jgi:serine/threonine protein kinase
MPESIRLDVGDAVASWTGITYRVVRFLGQGGSANAYLTICTEGKHRGLDFAVKAFRSASKPDRIINFMREVNVLRNCAHPSIMRVFDEGIYQEKYPFVVVEYLPRTLHDEIRSQVDFLTSISYTLHLLSALDYLQRLVPAVIHRDIKPRNVFVKGGSCILGDFGLLKHRRSIDDEDKDIFKGTHKTGPVHRRREAKASAKRTSSLVAFSQGRHPRDVGLRPRCTSIARCLVQAVPWLLSQRNRQERRSCLSETRRQEGAEKPNPSTAAQRP